MVRLEMYGSKVEKKSEKGLIVEGKQQKKLIVLFNLFAIFGIILIMLSAIFLLSAFKCINFTLSQEGFSAATGRAQLSAAAAAANASAMY